MIWIAGKAVGLLHKEIELREMDDHGGHRTGAEAAIFWELRVLSDVCGLAPIVGPMLGEWIADKYSWRWIFLIN